MGAHSIVDTSGENYTKKRILHLAESPYAGGISSHILSVLDAFQKNAEYEIVVAVLPGRRADVTLLKALRARGLPVHKLPMRHRFDISVLKALRRFVRDEKIDLVHTHNYRTTLLCALALPSLPRVTTFHGTCVAPTWRLRFWQALELRILRRQHAVIACSEFVREELRRRGLSDASLHCIHNAYMPTVQQQEKGGDGRAVFTEDPKALIALFVGRLVPGKGVEALLDAFAQSPHIHALILGDGPLRAALEAQARRLSIHAHFLGHIDEPSCYYRMVDFCVLPSEMEALPMVLIEAAAHGLPVIATAVGGIPEVVKDGETGLLIPYGDSVALLTALGAMSDMALRERLGRNARTRWETQFSPNRLCADLTGIYDEQLR